MSICLSCDPNCDDPDLPIKTCRPADVSTDTLLISDFESGADPTLHCGAIGTWAFPPNKIQVAARYDNQAPFSDTGQYAAHLQISGVWLAPGQGTAWCGGGLVMTFSGTEEGIDLRGFQFLEFDLRMRPGSNLEATQIRLEDHAHTQTPERFISQFGTLSETWSHFRIPLDTLCKVAWFDPPGTVPVIRQHVLNFSTISIHTGTEPVPTDGSLYIDNIRCIR